MELLRIAGVRPARWTVLRAWAVAERQLNAGVVLLGDYEPVFANDPHAEKLGVERRERSGPSVIARVVRTGEHHVGDLDSAVHGSIFSEWWRAQNGGGLRIWMAPVSAAAA